MISSLSAKDRFAARRKTRDLEFFPNCQGQYSAIRRMTNAIVIVNIRKYQFE
jgi:hypothetical protein